MAKKRLNKNLVIVLSLCMFALMIVLAVIMLNQLQKRDPKYFVDLAQNARTQQQWQQAALFYREAYSRSQDAAHLVPMGEMLLSDGEVRNALGAWQQALINQPDLIEAHMKLIELLHELADQSRNLNQWQQLLEAANTLIEVEVEITPTQEALAYRAMGLAMIHMKNQDESLLPQGMEALYHATELAPEMVDYAIELATEYIRNDQKEKGMQLLQQLIQEHRSPGVKASKVRLVYAQHLAIDKQFVQAELNFKKSMTLAEEESEALYDARLNYAIFISQKWAIAKRDEEDDVNILFDEAESILQQNIENQADRYEAYIQLAVLYKSAKQYEDVVDICQQRLERGLSRKGIHASSDRMHTFSLMIHASEACVTNALMLATDGDMGAKEQWLTRAQQYVTDARGEFPTHPRVASQSGRIKVARGAFRDALEDLRVAEEGYQSFETLNWENKIILARVHLRLNESGAARELLEDVAQQARRSPSVDAAFWMVYAQTLFQTESYDRALTIVDQILMVQNSHADALRLKAAIYERRGQPERAGELIETLTGDTAVRSILVARQLTLEGNAEGAIKVLQKALLTQPGDTRLISALVTEFTNLNRHDEARSVVQQALQKKPNDTALQKLEVYTKADLTPSQRDQAMLEVIQAESDEYKISLDLIAYYSRTQNTQGVLDAIKEAEKHLIARDTPLAKNTLTAHHRALLRLKIQLAVQLDDEEALTQARESAEKYNVDGSGGKSILGYYHMAHREFDLAIVAFREVISRQPTDSWSLSHLGQCLQITGRTDEAADAFERALHANPNEGIAHKGMAIIASNKGDESELQRHLKRCEQLIPNDTWVRDQLLKQKEKADPRGAIQRRVTLLENLPDDLNNIHQIAKLFEQIEDRSQADHYYDLLLQKNPESQSIVLEISAYYRRSDRPDRSLRVVTHYAQSRSTPEQRANANILIATHYKDMQQLDQAEDTLLNAVKKEETPDLLLSLAEFYLNLLKQPREALPWLNMAVEKAQANSSPSLKRILLTRIKCNLDRDINDTNSAKRDVEEFARLFSDDPRQKLWESEVFVRRGHIDRAVSSLSEYLTKRPDDLSALFRRAQHYIAQGKLGISIQDLQSIKRKDALALDLEPRFLLANLHGRRGQKDLWLRELESIVKDDPRSTKAIETLANAYLGESRAEDADRIVTAQINRTQNNSDPRWVLLRGRISLRLGQFDQALADFQRGAKIQKHSPQSIINVLDVYRMTRRFADGIRYYNKHESKHADQPALHARYATLLALDDKTAKSIQQFRATLLHTLEKSPDQTPFVTGQLQTAFPDERALTRAIQIVEDDTSTGKVKYANDVILIRLYRISDRLSDALKVITHLISTSTNELKLARLYQEQAELYQLHADPQSARHAYENAIELDQNNWMSLNNLAYILVEELTLPGDALPYAKKAVSLDENPASLDTLGWIYAMLEQYPSAIAELNRAIRLDPNQALAFYHLGEVYRRSGQFDDALTVLESSKLIAQETKEKNQKMLAMIEQSMDKATRQDLSIQ